MESEKKDMECGLPWVHDLKRIEAIKPSRYDGMRLFDVWQKETRDVCRFVANEGGRFCRYCSTSRSCAGGDLR